MSILSKIYENQGCSLKVEIQIGSATLQAEQQNHDTFTWKPDNGDVEKFIRKAREFLKNPDKPVNTDEGRIKPGKLGVHISLLRGSVAVLFYKNVRDRVVIFLTENELEEIVSALELAYPND